jgi:hypothetical protein
MSNAKVKKDPNRLVRKLGEREEVLETKLTQIQLEDMREEVMVLLDEEERIEKKRKEAAKNFGSQLESNKLQMSELRSTIASGKRKQTLIIEEHLTAQNEVVRIRQDTAEIIGQPRTATARELQEELFQDEPQPPLADAPAPAVAELEGFDAFDEPA